MRLHSEYGSKLHLLIFVLSTDSIKIFSSSNGVLLTEGLDGTVPPKYFKRVTHKLPTGELEELPVESN